MPPLLFSDKLYVPWAVANLIDPGLVNQGNTNWIYYGKKQSFISYQHPECFLLTKIAKEWVVWMMWRHTAIFLFKYLLDWWCNGNFSTCQTPPQKTFWTSLNVKPCFDSLYSTHWTFKHAISKSHYNWNWKNWNQWAFFSCLGVRWCRCREHITLMDIIPVMVP